MQLRSISFQTSSPPSTEPFSERYKATRADEEIGRRILGLIEYLQHNIEAPPQWICTSHYNLHFFEQDADKFAGFADNPHWTFMVEARQTGFTIVTYANPPWISQIDRTEHCDTVEEAARVIADVLAKRANWVELRWLREQYEANRKE